MPQMTPITLQPWYMSYFTEEQEGKMYVFWGEGCEIFTFLRKQDEQKEKTSGVAAGFL
jgi:predicted RNA-binding protein with PUA domain